VSSLRWKDCGFPRAENGVDEMRKEEEARHVPEVVEDQLVCGTLRVSRIFNVVMEKVERCAWWPRGKSTYP